MYKSPDHFTLYRTNRNGHVIFGYYCYDSKGRHVYRSTGMSTKEEALAVIRERIRLGRLADPPKVNPRVFVRSVPNGETLFADYAAQFFVKGRCPYMQDRLLRGGHVTVGYISSLRGLLNNYILPYFGQMLMSEIRRGEVNRWLLHLPSLGLSNNTANKVLGALRIILDFAVFEDVIERNPAKEVRTLAKCENARLAFSVEQEERLVAYHYDNILAGTAIRLAASTGLRAGEIRALKWSDVRMDRIVVAHSYTNKDGYKGTKSGKVREVPIRHDIYEMLAFLYHGDPDAYLFSYNGRRPVNHKVFNASLKKAMTDLGIDDQGGRLSFHSFRHFFNTRLIEGGVQSVVVQAVVGHSSDAMTSRYLHVDAGRLEDVKQIQRSISIG